jgi:hypothetical protein
MHGGCPCRDLDAAAPVASDDDDSGARACGKQRQLDRRSAVETDARARNLLGDGLLSLQGTPPGRRSETITPTGEFGSNSQVDAPRFFRAQCSGHFPFESR